jgi:hypothetical protein
VRPYPPITNCPNGQEVGVIDIDEIGDLGFEGFEIEILL